jgi:hypothetical protein
MTPPRISERKEYLQKVLSPAVSHHRAPDLFARYGLDPSEDDDRVIGEQVAFAAKLWRNSTDHEKYGDLVRQLLKEHTREQAKLTDHATRRVARETILLERAGDERARFAGLESAINELKQHDGGLLMSYRADLVELGVRSGLGEQEVTDRLDLERFADDIGATRLALADDRHMPIIRRLASLSAQASDLDVGPTLFSFLGAPFSAPRDVLLGRHQLADQDNDKRPHGDQKRLASHLLADARRYLIESDVDLYRAAVISGVKERLRSKVHHHKVIGRGLDRSAFRSLVEEAVDQGLDDRWGETAVRELAAAERLQIDSEPPDNRPIEEESPKDQESPGEDPTQTTLQCPACKTTGAMRAVGRFLRCPSCSADVLRIPCRGCGSLVLFYSARLGPHWSCPFCKTANTVSVKDYLAMVPPQVRWFGCPRCGRRIHMKIEDRLVVCAGCQMTLVDQPCVNCGWRQVTAKGMPCKHCHAKEQTSQPTPPECPEGSTRPPPPPPPPPPPTNWGVVALVIALVFPPAGLILGIMALRKIAASNGQLGGRGAAWAACIIGGFVTAAGAFIVLFVLGILVVSGGTGGATG